MLPRITAFDSEEYHEFTLDGDHPVAVLVHGFPGTPHEMRPFANALHREGWTVHAVLLPGFGPEINELPAARFEHWLDKVIATVAHYQRKKRPVMLVGFSMGGAISITAAAQTRPDALVLLAPFYRINHILWKILPVIQTILPTVKPFKAFKPNFADPNFREAVTRFMPDIDLDDPATQKAVREFTLPIRMFAQIRKAGIMAYQNAPQVTCPTLVIQGSEDELVTPSNTRTLTARLGTQAKWVTVKAPHELFRHDAPAWNSIETHLNTFADGFDFSPVQQRERP